MEELNVNFNQTENSGDVIAEENKEIESLNNPAIVDSEEVNAKDETVVKEFFVKETGVTLKELAVLFGQTEAEISKEYGAFKAQKMYGKMDYLIDEGVISFDEFKSKCALAVKYGFKSVTVLPNFVALAKGILNGKGVLVKCLISYPFGEDLVRVKHCAVKSAVKMGADEISVVISPREVRYGNYKLIVKSLKKVVKLAKKRPVCAILPSKNLTPYEMQKLARLIARESKVSSVMAVGVNGESYLELLKETVMAVNGKCHVDFLGDIKTPYEAVSILSSGANRITSANCPEIANQLNIKIITSV